MQGDGGFWAPAACWGPELEDREGQGAEEKSQSFMSALAEGFTVLQQCPTAGSTSSGQDRKGAQGKKDNASALLEGEEEWNVGA